MMYRRVIFALSGLGIVLAVGTGGYMFLGDWDFLDALYMTVITVGTVGYDEVRELSDPGRIFTMLLIFAGFGAMVFFLGTMIDFVVEGHLKGILEGRRMQRRISTLSRHHVVAGLGRVGMVVARTLAEEGVPFVVVDIDKDAIARAHEKDWIVVEGDATEEETLLAAGVDKAHSLVTALDTDADNLFVTFTSRALNADLFIVSRSTSERSESRIKKAGANRVITPNEIGGRRMAAMVTHPVISDFLDVVSHGEQVEFRLQEVELKEGCPLAGKSIKDARVRDATGAYILAVQGQDGDVNTNPSSDTVLRLGDKLVALGTEAQLNSLMDSL